jgi:hypothetical protein
MTEPLSAVFDDHQEQRWSCAGPLRSAVTVIQYAYPIVMLVFFLAAFTLRSIAASNSNTNIAKPTTTGPGGKPLPATDPTRNFVKKTVHDDVTQTQKRVFEWVSLATAFTFVGNSVVVISHALAKEEEHWWAGKAVVVCPTLLETIQLDTNCPDLPRWRLFRLLSLSHLAPRFEALADRGPSGDMDSGYSARNSASGLLVRHLHAPSQGAHRGPSSQATAVRHD